MTVYEHRASVTTASGSIGSSTLNMKGLLRDVLVRANTATTVFRVDLTDSNSVIRLNYAFHTGEMHDDKISFPVQGTYTVNITNASPNDIFTLVLAVQE